MLTPSSKVLPNWSYTTIQKFRILLTKIGEMLLFFPFSAGVPEVKIDPPTLTTQEGGNLTFTCLVTGVPTPTIRWRTEHLQSSWTLQVHDIYCIQVLKFSMKHQWK